MAVQPITDEQLAEQGYPSAEQMLELVNNDLLPFFAEQKTSKQPSASLTYKVLELLGESDKDFIFKREDGYQLGAWKEYFLNPTLWKKNRLLKIQGLVY